MGWNRGLALAPPQDSFALAPILRGQGNRDAFGRIVERYQSLICSLAYSACGNLAFAEDLAQETFVIAWQRLGELRDAAKLRSWLCGIVRNLSAISIGSGDDVGSRSRAAMGWIAVGDWAISPLVALGGFAIGPLAVGGVTVGLLSFSLWGVAVGGLSVGSVSVGWWSIGMGALGVQAAAGCVALARDYALGILASAQEANTDAAREWFVSQWFVAPVKWFVYSAHWIILVIAIAAYAWRRRRK